MGELNYEDFKRRINIQDLLTDAGYSLNKRDGLRYPSYVRMDSAGQRVRGDKFIVTANGLCCFHPPEQKNYNVISFIKEHPHFFSDYSPGMNTDRLVNLVCNRLLNQPIDRRPLVVADRARSEKMFDLKAYKRIDFHKDDWDNQKAFYPYFKSRGITRDTQCAFGNHFFIAMIESSNGKTYTNLSFPLVKPNDLATIVGLEERGRTNDEGKSMYKGMAAGSNATEGLWIANLSGNSLDKAKDVYWFESAYDAMAFYQITKNDLNSDSNRTSGEELLRLDESVFVSTGGHPSIHQFKAMIAETPEANHHLCFDRDRAGQMFAINFALTQAGKTFNTHVTPRGKLVVVDTTDGYLRHELNPELFEFDQLLKILGADTCTKRSEMAEYMESLRNKEDIFSGEEYLLPPDLLQAYGKYEVACEEYHSAKYSGLVCKEDLEDIGDELKTSYEAYRAAMKNAVSQYKPAGLIIYQPCETAYKDWNDQLLDKRLVLDNNESEDRNCHFHR